MGESGRPQWDVHWERLQGRFSLFGFITRAVRLIVIRPAVRFYAERFFPDSGVFVEMGCGTGESSTGIPQRDRRLVGLDFSLPAIRAARANSFFAGLVQGDIRSLPFEDASLDGIWNHGVMEHFEREQGIAILREFSRVMRPGSHVILFWPPRFGSSRMVLGPLEWLISTMKRRPFEFFPDEVNRLKSRDDGREHLTAAGFEVVRADRTWRDAFIHTVLVGRRP